MDQIITSISLTMSPDYIDQIVVIFQLMFDTTAPVTLTIGGCHSNQS